MASPDNPILNAPFEAPRRHWSLDPDGGFTTQIVEGRRRSEYLVPIAPPRRTGQRTFQFETPDELGRATEPNALVNEIRSHVERWRALPVGESGLTYETARLLEHWRSGETKPPLFFCQIEAAETIIWLEEIAARQANLRHLRDALKAQADRHNPGLFRLAAKMATGSGKTTVMAMLIAWQAINAARGRRSYSDAFLVVCPGITIKDRLRVLYPSDPDNYYESRGLVPDDMLGAIRSARLVITNYHAFKLRETLQLPKYARAVLKGRDEEPQTKESEGQMLARVCPELLGRKNVVVLNDEAHHCYQEKLDEADEAIDPDSREEARKNAEAARLWVNGLHALNRKVGIRAVYDVSATPFFLRGSGYREGTLFPWVISDFALIDAIECGIVKIPRVPVSDNSLGYAPAISWSRRSVATRRSQAGLMCSSRSFIRRRSSSAGQLVRPDVRPSATTACSTVAPRELSRPEDRFNLASTSQARVGLQLHGGIPLCSDWMWKSKRRCASSTSCKLIPTVRLRQLANKCTPGGSPHAERRSAAHPTLQSRCRP